MRLKRRFTDHMQAVNGYDEATVDIHLLAIGMSEQSTAWKPFGQFHIKQARAFKRWLAKQTNQCTGKPLSKSTFSQALKANQKFFLWLANQPGSRSKIGYADTEYFTPDRRDARAAVTTVVEAVPTPGQVRHVISKMPDNTEIEKRDRAPIAFTFLTGARHGALASLRLKHIDVAQRRVAQGARNVHTKGGKTIQTWFFPVGEEIERIVLEWVQYLEIEKLFGCDDPLFPRTKVEVGVTGGFQAGGFGRDPWRTVEPARKVFWAAFENAGLAAFNPHPVRHALARHGEQCCKTPEEFKAWSQNVGHEKVLTTFSSYGKVGPHRQGELTSGLRQRGSVSQTEPTEHLIDALRTLLSKSKKDIS